MIYKIRLDGRVRSATKTRQQRAVGARRAVPLPKDLLYAFDTESGPRRRIGAKDFSPLRNSQPLRTRSSGLQRHLIGWVSFVS